MRNLNNYNKASVGYAAAEDRFGTTMHEVVMYISCTSILEETLNS